MEYPDHRLDLEANPGMPTGNPIKIKREPHCLMESHARSAVKDLSWRVTAGMVTTSVVWVITREKEPPQGGPVRARAEPLEASIACRRSTPWLKCRAILIERSR
jgi:hypothetical protein